MIKIKEVLLKFGSSEGKDALSFKPTPITVFVGPNNSGKSQLIRELDKFFQEGKNSENKILEGVSYEPLSEKEIEDFFKDKENKFQKNNYEQLEFSREGIENFSWNLLSKEKFKEVLREQKSKADLESFSKIYLSYRVLLLTGENRLGLLNEQAGYDQLKEKPRTTLQKLHFNNALREKYREIVYQGLDVYPVIDTLNRGNFRPNFSEEKPESEDIERSQKQEAVDFHKKALPLNESSDGRKAYAGILAEVMTGDPEILLMDEPEAFLHPALAQKLGTQLARLLKEKEKYLFVATHSASFLMGVIQSGVPVNIVRLTYQKQKATARLLESERLKELMRNPLLRSANALGALFYENVIITEADADRAFYQEINERLLAKGRGIQNVLFLNAQNKQTIPRIMKPLRDLGIPVAAIYDIDLLFDNGTEASSYVEAAYIAESSIEGLRGKRSNLADRILNGSSEKENKDIKKDIKMNGISGFAKAKEMGKELEEYCADLAKYGVFLVEEGELESWLKDLGVKARKERWLLEIFEKMGEDPEDPSYVHPKENDVWSFLEKIKKWFEDPSRKGLPE